jgi:hypothetical protein
LIPLVHVSGEFWTYASSRGIPHTTETWNHSGPLPLNELAYF